VDDGHTHIVTFARNADFTMESRVHCLELLEGLDAGRCFIVSAPGASVGRISPADIVLADSEVSRTHCRLALENGILTATDLNSTNGTFVDGVRISRPTQVPVGAILRVGRLPLKHEWRTQREILQHDEFDRDLKKARSYVEALLPAAMQEGMIRSDWLYEPCAKLGGDAFGYGFISDTQFLIYLFDVSGHGAGAAMHSVAVMNLLRQRSLPGTDMSNPDAVLAALNQMFPMDNHAGMYFTMWYGIYDTVSRQLNFASGGHHPSYLVHPDRTEAIALQTRCGLIGADFQTSYRSDMVEVPQGASIYLFSDGVFEIVTIDGVEWRLSDFIPHLLQPLDSEMSESKRLFQAVRELARPGGLDDDFSLLVLTFN
jgi:hypothetical protein